MGIIFNSLLLYFFIYLHYGSANQTQICDNINASDPTNEPISLTATNFVQFIQNSAFYVDKSLLLIELLHKTKNITTKVITAPSKWGKSLNLNMVKFFTEMETDQDGNQVPIYETSAYKYFGLGIIPDRKHRMENPPLVFQHDKFIHKYLAKYPVIYIDFANLEPEDASFYSVIDAFSQLISTIFSKFSYVRKIWQDLGTNITEVERMVAKQDLLQFNKYLEGVVKDVHKLAHCISFLSESLYKFFGTRPIILHDKYDKLIHVLYFDSNRTFSEESRLRVRSFYTLFMSITYRTNLYTKFSVITGIYKLEKGSFFPKLYDDIYECSVFDENIIHPFYGFSKTEISSLMEKRGLQHQEKDIEKFYSGYKIIGQDDLHNPWVIANYINKKEFGIYWNDGESSSFIENLCFYRKSRNLLESLVGQKIYSISKGKIKLGCNQCEALAKSMNRTAERNESSFTYTNLLSYLHNIGYLSSTGSSLPLKLKIVNREVSYYLADKLLNYYVYLVKYAHFVDILNEKCVDIMKDFIHNDETYSSKLTAVISEIFQYIGAYPHKMMKREPGQKPLRTRKLMKKGQLNGNEDLVRTIMLVPAMRLHVKYKYDLKIEQTLTCITAKATEQEDSKKIALVIESRHVGEGNTKVRTTRHPFTYSYYFDDESEVDIIKYVEIRVMNDGSAKVLYSKKIKDNKEQ